MTGLASSTVSVSRRAFLGLGYERPRDVVMKTGLGAADREKIFGGNAGRLLRV